MKTPRHRQPGYMEAMTNLYAPGGQTMETTTCETCKHMQAMPDGDECRRHPPRVSEAIMADMLIGDWTLEEALETASCYPTTKPDSYCGEWTRKQ